MKSATARTAFLPDFGRKVFRQLPAGNRLAKATPEFRVVGGALFLPERSSLITWASHPVCSSARLSATCLVTIKRGYPPEPHPPPLVLSSTDPAATPRSVERGAC